MDNVITDFYDDGLINDIERRKIIDDYSFIKCYDVNEVEKYIESIKHKYLETERFEKFQIKFIEKLFVAIKEKRLTIKDYFDIISSLNKEQNLNGKYEVYKLIKIFMVEL